MTKLDIRKASVREREEAARRAAERAERRDRLPEHAAVLWTVGRVLLGAIALAVAWLPALEHGETGRRLWLQMQAWGTGGDPRLIHAANTPYGSVLADPFAPAQWDLLAFAASWLGPSSVWAIGALGLLLAMAAWALRPYRRHLGGGFLLALGLAWALHAPLAALALLALGLAAWAVHGARLGGLAGAFAGPVLLGGAAVLAPGLAPVFLAMGVALAATRARRLHAPTALGFVAAGLFSASPFFLVLGALALLPAFLSPRRHPHRWPLPLLLVPSAAVLLAPPQPWGPTTALLALGLALAGTLVWAWTHRHSPMMGANRPHMAAALAGSLALGTAGVHGLIFPAHTAGTPGMDGATILALWAVGIGALWLPALRGWGNNLQAGILALCAGALLYTPTPTGPTAPACSPADLADAVTALSQAGIRRVATDPHTGYALLAQGAPFSVVAAGLGDQGDADIHAILHGDDLAQARRLLLQRSVGAVLVCGTPPTTGLAHALWDGGSAALAPTAAWLEAGPVGDTTAIGWITIGLDGAP